MSQVKLAAVLVKRKLCQFSELREFCSKGDVRVANSYNSVIGITHTVYDPNTVLSIPPNGSITVYVKNRGNTIVYNPWFEGDHLTVTRYDYGEHVWEVVERLNAIVAVPIIGDSVVLVNVYRPVFHKKVLELPAGIMNTWEQACDTALRELKEETGYTAGAVTFMFTGYTSPGYSTEEAHFYLCESLQPGEQKLDKEEQIEVLVTPLWRAQQLIKERQIVDLKTIAAISYLSAGNLPKNGTVENRRFLQYVTSDMIL